MWLYYMDEFVEVDCGGLSLLECALAKAGEAGCRASRACLWDGVVEIFCAGGGAAKLLPTPHALYQYYQHQTEARCLEGLN
ncbi:hypothetical protein [Pyrobaculum ferrireducens]|uniref:hypothetical protein n=1 Tax=Pyrobaculum ferrireducens TaxID=1104324 RepID=UPI000AFE517A|nr:hypothetical protein [Pyrobaculum ferrireducens]